VPLSDEQILEKLRGWQRLRAKKRDDEWYREAVAFLKKELPDINITHRVLHDVTRKNPELQSSRERARQSNIRERARTFP
jgi:hypothetical protein